MLLVEYFSSGLWAASATLKIRWKWFGNKSSSQTTTMWYWNSVSTRNVRCLADPGLRSLGGGGALDEGPKLNSNLESTHTHTHTLNNQEVNSSRIFGTNFSFFAGVLARWGQAVPVGSHSWIWLSKMWEWKNGSTKATDGVQCCSACDIRWGRGGELASQDQEKLRWLQANSILLACKTQTLEN